MLFLVKYSMPDIANVVWNLSKVNNRANYVHYKQILTEKTREKCELKCMWDSYYAWDKNNGLSVTGYYIYVNGWLISWKSRAQRRNALSSTGAEYVALSEICTEILFLRMIKEFLVQLVEYTIKVCCDNAGPIYLAYNERIPSISKHVDTRAHFVRRYVEDGTIKIIFVRPEENDSDIFTKDTSESTYKKHTENFMIQNST